MKRFVFRLAKLQRLREAERRSARITLASALGDLAAAERAREGIAQEIDEGGRWQPPPEALRAAAEWLAGLRWREGQAEETTERAAHGVQEAEVVCTHHERRVRALEQLRSRQHARWRVAADREEQKNLDEIHLLRLFGGRRAQGGGSR